MVSVSFSSSLIIVLSIFVCKQDYAGRIDLLNDSGQSANDLANGYPLQLKISFPTQNPLPTIKELYYNDQLLCSAETGNEL